MEMGGLFFTTSRVLFLSGQKQDISCFCPDRNRIQGVDSYLLDEIDSDSTIFDIDSKKKNFFSKKKIFILGIWVKKFFFFQEFFFF